jgi:hypothetical protein
MGGGKRTRGIYDYNPCTTLNKECVVTNSYDL